MGWLERLKLPPVPALGRLSPDKVGREAEDYLRRIKDALGAFSLEGLVSTSITNNIVWPVDTTGVPGDYDGTSTQGVGPGVSLSGHTHAIPDGALTYAKIQDVSAASKLLGRGSAGGAGDVQEITVGSGLTMTGTTLSTASAPDVNAQFLALLAIAMGGN